MLCHSNVVVLGCCVAEMLCGRHFALPCYALGMMCCRDVVILGCCVAGKFWFKDVVL
jgi:hypothetical protein